MLYASTSSQVTSLQTRTIMSAGWAYVRWTAVLRRTEFRRWTEIRWTEFRRWTELRWTESNRAGSSSCSCGWGICGCRHHWFQESNHVVCIPIFTHLQRCFIPPSSFLLPIDIVFNKQLSNLNPIIPTGNMQRVPVEHFTLMKITMWNLRKPHIHRPSSLVALMLMYPSGNLQNDFIVIAEKDTHKIMVGSYSSFCSSSVSVLFET